MATCGAQGQYNFCFRPCYILVFRLPFTCLLILKFENVEQAFNVGAKDQSEPVKSGKDLVESVQDVHLKKEDIEEEFIKNQEHNEEVSVESEKFPAPLTPQLKQGMRLVDNGDCQDQDQTNISTEKECVDHDGESKFVEATCDNLVADAVTTETNSSKSLEEGIGKPLSDECCEDLKNDGKKQKEASEKDNSRATKSSRRKIKVRC